MVGEEYRSWSSWLWSFLHSPHHLVPLRPKYSPQHPPYSQTPSAYILPSMSATKFHTHTKQGKIIVLYMLIFKFYVLQQI
jgi:hypothetical protein